MGRLVIVPFADEHLDAAGELLAERHRRHRRAEPLLAERYEDPAVARLEVESALRQEGASGAVALTGDDPVGYLVGAPKEESWGPNIWIEAAGHAVRDAEAIRDLYAAAAARWVADGRTRHYALVPASETELVDAWFRLCFGQQHAHGIREVSVERWPPAVRLATPADVEGMLDVAPLIGRHQALAPVFSGRTQEDDRDELRAEIHDDLTKPEIANLVAEVDGRIAGNFVVVPAELTGSHTGLARPDEACFLGFAATDPAVRGSGVGLALTQASFAWAGERGYRSMFTDWRVTNLLSSRFWPARGFRQTFVRLYRSIP